MNLLARLREQTRPHHDAVEQQLGLLDGPWSAERYRALLGRFFGYYDPLEARIGAAADWSGLGFDWSRRRKAALLRSDLAARGDTPDAIAALPRCTDLPDVGGLQQALGCMYVLEGATLGGRVVTRHLAAEPGLAGGAGFAFFSSYGAEVGPMWRAFGDFLVSQSGSGDEAVVGAACDTFAPLARWLCGAGP